MSHSRMVRAKDVTRILRLRDELDDLPPNANLRWGHVMDASCRLFGAVLSASGTGKGFLPGPKHQPQYIDAVEAGSLDLAERLVFYRYLQNDQCVDPCVRRLAAIPAKLFTRARRHLVDDKEWYSLDHVNVDRRGARVDAVLFSGFRLDRNGTLRMIGLHREWGDKPYSEQDRTLLHLLHRAVAKKVYLTDDPLAEVRAMLSPRLMETFQLLLAGLPEKHVASRLGLSRHTIHGYVKEIYRRLRVESRPELMARYGQPR